MQITKVLSVKEIDDYDGKDDNGEKPRYKVAFKNFPACLQYINLKEHTQRTILKR